MHTSLLLRALAFATLFISHAASADWRLTIVAPRSVTEAEQRWSPFANYLSQELKTPVKLQIVSAADVPKTIAKGDSDFVMCAGTHAIYAEEMTKAKILASLNTESGAHFAGVIIVPKSSAIRTVEDLRGKRVVTSSKKSAGAYVFQMYYLMQRNVAEKDVTIVELNKQDNTFTALKKGMAEAAFVRSGVLEEMIAENKITADEYVVLDAKENKEGKFVYTTDLYPEWFFFALPSVPDDVTQRVTQALLKIAPDAPISQTARMRGFSAPLDLKSSRDAMRALGIAPFQKNSG